MNLLYKQARSRQVIYEALAKGFDRLHYRYLTADDVEVVAGCLNQYGLTISEALSSLEKAVSRMTGGVSMELKLEYGRLFFGPFRLLAPPYESVYREGRRVMGQCTVEVIQSYKAAGLAVSPSFQEVADHIVAELDFMAFLCEQEALSWQGNNLPQACRWIEHQVNFYHKHLNRWADSFCQAIERHGKASYYLALAEILQTFTGREGSYLSLLGQVAEKEQKQVAAEVACWLSQPDNAAAPGDGQKAQRRFLLTALEDQCTMCGACIIACQTKVLGWKESVGQLALNARHTACQGCGKCVQVCPEKALQLHQVSDITQIPAIEEQVLAVAFLASCANCAIPFAPIKTLEKIVGILSQGGQGSGEVVQATDTDQVCPVCRSKAVFSHRIKGTERNPAWTRGSL